MIPSISFSLSEFRDLGPLLDSYRLSLSHPLDSHFEGLLLHGKISKIRMEGREIGFFCSDDRSIQFFHIIPGSFQFAPIALEETVKLTGLSRVSVPTQDPLLVSLISEWDFKVERGACLFIDAGRLPMPCVPCAKAQFRPAEPKDAEAIAERTGDPVDVLRGRIVKQSIYILEDRGVVLGRGNMEPGRIFPDCVSIGMLTCRDQRNKGVAKMMLWHLKELAYQQHRRPVAGCWYYNTLSRRSLEASGMAAASKVFEAVLLGKEILPERTGNPPGEPAE